MARPFRHITPDLLQIREGGGCMSVFGLPFFAAGVFMALTVMGVIPVSNADEMPRWGWAALSLMSVAFTAVGGTLVFGRTWTTLDITQRIVRKQWGPLVPVHEKTQSLSGFTAVTLGFVAGDSDSSDQFPIRLKARTGPDLQLCSFTTYAESRACAVAIATHLRLDVEDATTDHEVRLPPGEADRPFLGRAWDEPAQEATVERPARARSEVTREAGHTRIVIPHRRMHPVGVAAALLPLAVLVVMVPWLAEFFRRTNTPGPVGWAFLAFLVLGFGVLPVMTVVNAFVRSRRGGTIVNISRQGIQIQERGAWRTRSTASIDAADILDVDYSTRASAVASAKRAAEQAALQAFPADAAKADAWVERLMAWLARFGKGRGLTIKARDGLTTFGDGLEDEEIRYLHSIVRRGLRA